PPATGMGQGGGALAKAHGEIKLTALASMFKKIRFHSHENIGSGPIHLPEQTLHTTAYWVTFERAGLVRDDLEAGLQGLAHALRHVASLRLMCDPRDLGSTAEVRSTTTLRPTVTIYEVYPGGVGYAPRLYELHDQLLSEAAELVSECPCEAGCPSCTGPVPGAKQACLQLLQGDGAGMATRGSVARWPRSVVGAEDRSARVS